MKRGVRNGWGGRSVQGRLESIGLVEMDVDYKTMNGGLHTDEICPREVLSGF